MDHKRNEGIKFLNTYQNLALKKKTKKQSAYAEPKVFSPLYAMYKKPSASLCSL